MSDPRLVIRRAWLLALALVVASFCVGYGYGAGRRNAANSPGTPTKTPTATPASNAPSPPAVKGMRLAPGGKLLGFTATYDNARLASRFILDLTNNRYDAREAPRGWQDYVSGWTRDGKVLLERERIPRPVDDATAGFYEERVRATGQGITRKPPALVSGESLNADDKVIGGFLDPEDHLVVKTRREPKGLFALSAGDPQLLVRTNSQFYQQRAAKENGTVAYYVVRDVPGPQKRAALFRIQGKTTKQLGPLWSSPTWVYLREDARQLVVCAKADGEDGNWNWTLYDVTPQGMKERKATTIPADVIAVYWSPDGKTMLGTGGDDVWAIDIATLSARKLPRRPGNVPWSADDAAWLDKDTGLIAIDGKFWRLKVRGNAALTLVWSIPQKYWK